MTERLESTQQIPGQEYFEWLSRGDNLEARLREMDQGRSVKRIFVMGCGRSGTWLLAAVMSTFRDIELVPQELGVEYFGIRNSHGSTLVLKRKHDSYRTIENIPNMIGIACIVRHPYDVLTSHNPITRLQYHVTPHRWLGEMSAVKYLFDSKKANSLIIRYEDLVTDAEGVQVELGATFRLQIETHVSAFVDRFRPSPNTAIAMHGVRPIDKNSICRYKSHPEQVEYLKTIVPGLQPTLEWVGRTFDYDLSL